MAPSSRPLKAVVDVSMMRGRARRYAPALLLPILAVLLGLAYFFLPPLHSLSVRPRDGAWIALFVVVSSAATWLVMAARRERAAARSEAAASATITGVAHLVSAELDLEKLVQALTDAATRLSGAAFGAFFYNVGDQEGERYMLHALSGASREAFEGFPPPTFRGPGVIRLADVTKDPRYGTNAPSVGKPAGHLPVVSYLAVPVVARSGEVLGGLFFGHPEAGVFEERHEQLVGALAAQAAKAMENARRYEAEQRARTEAEAAGRRAAFLADASAIIGSTLDYEAVLQRVAELAVPRMGDWCAVFMRDDAERIRCVTYQHRDAAITDKGRRYITDQPIDVNAPHGAGKVIRTGVSELVPDASEEWIRAVASDEEGVRIRLEMGHRSVLAVPLRVGQSVLGAIVLGRGRPHAYTAADLALAEGISRHVSLAIENARLYREARAARETAERARWQAALLAEASRLLASSLDYDATLEALIRLAVPGLADWVVVHIARRDGTVRRIGPAYADPRLALLAEEIRRAAPPLRVTGIASVTVDVVRSGRPFLLGDVSGEWLEQAIPDPAYRTLVLRLAPRSMMIVPLAARGRTLGALTFLSLQDTRRYGDVDLAFAEEIGRRAGVAIDNARLYRHAERARAEAEDANRAKDEFLAVLSHELRTPLNAIAGWVKMLETGTLHGAEAERGVAAVGRNVRVLRRLIEDLLDVSGIVAGKVRLERAPCDLAPIIEQTLESLDREAQAKDVRLKAELETGVVVDADAVRLRQVIGNLVSNAVKFTPAGGAVTVALRRANGRAAVSVSDTGSGIAPEILPHVFDRFRQADSSTTRRHGGLGLGLAIVKHLVELHGGAVRAESAGEGQGATFTIELPTLT